MTRSPRRPERFEVVVGDRAYAIVVGVDGVVRADGRAIGEIENTRRRIPRSSRWRATAGEKVVTGYTAADAAAALAYAVLRETDVPDHRIRLRIRR